MENWSEDCGCEAVGLGLMLSGLGAGLGLNVQVASHVLFAVPCSYKVFPDTGWVEVLSK